MRRHHLYFTAGVVCLGISLCLYAYGRIAASRTASATSDQQESVSQPAPTHEPVVTSRPPRKREEGKPNNSKQGASAELLPIQPYEVQVPDPQPALLPSPTPERQRTVTPQFPDKLTPQQCEERIAALERGVYAYIPRECEDQYRAWRRFKSDQERDERERQREAERQRDEDRRTDEEQTRRRQERIDRTTRTIKGIIDDVRRRRN